MIKSVNNIGHQVSAIADSYMHARSKNIVRARALALGAVFTGIFMVSTANVAMAQQTLKDYSTTVSGNTNIIVDIVGYICYLGGAILSALGIVDLKKHVEQPTQVPLKNGLAKLGFGGILLALPFVAGVMQKTMAGSGEATFQKFSNKPTI